MRYSLSIRKAAEADIAEAYQYYESCRENLGADFTQCIDESISRIEKNPRQYKVIHKNVHRALVTRFPFGIYYVLIDSVFQSLLYYMHARTRNIGGHAHNKQMQADAAKAAPLI